MIETDNIIIKKLSVIFAIPFVFFSREENMRKAEAIKIMREKNSKNFYRCETCNVLVKTTNEKKRNKDICHERKSVMTPGKNNKFEKKRKV